MVNTTVEHSLSPPFIPPIYLSNSPIHCPLLLPSSPFTPHSHTDPNLHVSHFHTPHHPSVHPITLPYTPSPFHTLHHPSVHPITLPYTPSLFHTLHHPSIHSITLPYTPSPFHTLYHSSIHSITLPYTPSPFHTLHHPSIHPITLHTHPPTPPSLPYPPLFPPSSIRSGSAPFSSSTLRMVGKSPSAAMCRTPRWWLSTSLTRAWASSWEERW